MYLSTASPWLSYRWCYRDGIVRWSYKLFVAPLEVCNGLFLYLCCMIIILLISFSLYTLVFFFSCYLPGYLFDFLVFFLLSFFSVTFYFLLVLFLVFPLLCCFFLYLEFSCLLYGNLSFRAIIALACPGFLVICIADIFLVPFFIIILILFLFVKVSFKFSYS